MSILVIVAHPSMDESRLNAYLERSILGAADITVNNLYHRYPDEKIDIKREQRLLMEHERIVFQFPNYWYSYPPLLKKWFDLVLERGWAFKGGYALGGKEFGVALSSGFTTEDYRFDGLHRHSIEQIMAPFYATCNFIRTKSLPIFNTFEDEMKTEADLEQQAEKYLLYLRKAFTFHYNS
ncbi:NAD(P)H-dependent oxidoreductase [Aquibacillus rhizosphaerae]|uniref:NAD(P)H-dependent oxidoreductase n=1 Tax=Aquibacillus rhizosphaerae TaxID=3051431 RepID=A0ABT7L8T5_9BACI|nr:NAD(P)H-dependent oxidoreductase [Aquibacillus sp. LR5S19]MDL4842277.1 NAD(P)H-dependent oxidoreductase [Aquibacillus sp. LR5S19]